MTTMTNLLVKDDTVTTRVEYTFVPVTDTPNPLWRTQIAGVPFEGQMTLEVSAETLKSGDRKYLLKLGVPVMETLGASGTSAGYVAPPQVAYTNWFYGTVVANKRSTQADRANLFALGTGMLIGASSVTATGILDQSSAGSAFKTSVLPMPDLFINGSTPF